MKFHFAYQKKEEEIDDSPALCEFPGCQEHGVYPAPKRHVQSHRDKPNTWHWFCLNHVRDYNARWNYYAHMEEQEVLQEWRKDITWRRPSWPLGSWTSRYSKISYDDKAYEAYSFQFQDPFGLFSDQDSKPLQTSFSTIEEEAMAVLNVGPVFNAETLQQAYRHMVKQHHPDINSDATCEDMIRKINQAYEVLKKRIMDF